MADSVIVTATAPVLTGVWIHDPASPDTTERNWPHANGGEHTVDVDETILQPIGRRCPLLETGTSEDEHVAVTVTIPAGPDCGPGVEWWLAVKRAGRTLMFRDGRGRAFKAALVGALKFSDQRSGSVLPVMFQRVDYPAAGTLAASDYAPNVTDDGGKGDGGLGVRGKGL